MRNMLVTLFAVTLALVAGAALAQEPPGVPDTRAVNPAPGASNAYLGHSPEAYYNIEGRLAETEQRAASLPASQRQRALREIRAIRGEASTQRKRHGELREWDYENLNYRLDKVISQFPRLAGGQ